MLQKLILNSTTMLIEYTTFIDIKKGFVMIIITYNTLNNKCNIKLFYYTNKQRILLVY